MLQSKCELSSIKWSVSTTAVSAAVVYREHEEAMDVLQGDIDALEHEKTELRERVKELSRKTLMEGIVRQSSAGQIHTIHHHHHHHHHIHTASPSALSSSS